MTALSLNGRRALVIRANTGIGRANALGLTGADVTAARQRGRDGTLTLIAAAGGPAGHIRLDLSDPFAAAGIILRGDSLDHTEADWDAVTDIDLKPMFLAVPAFVMAAMAPGAPRRIVNIASQMSLRGASGARQMAAHNGEASTPTPGHAETDNTRAVQTDPGRRRAILERIPPGAGTAPPISPGRRLYCGRAPPTTFMARRWTSAAAGRRADRPPGQSRPRRAQAVAQR